MTIDLSSGTVARNEIDDRDFITRYLGERGIAIELLLSGTEPTIDPDDPESPLIFAPGVLTGTMAPSSGRTSVIFKSPATGRFFKTSVGGTLEPS